MLVDANVLPEVFAKVLEAKLLADTGEEKTVLSAVKRVGISRSAFYKYRDSVFPFTHIQGVLTLLAVVVDMRGILSEILQKLSDAACSVLTINQGIPINGIANITITLSTDAMNVPLDRLIGNLTRIGGVRSVKILAKQ